MKVQRPVQDPLLEALLLAQALHQLFPLHKTKTLSLVVAVSGGGDSVALLHLLHTLQDEWNLDLHIAHFDHALRPSSADDARFVAQLAQSLGLPFHLETNHLKTNRSTNPQTAVNEATLRTLRYKFLYEIAHKIAPAQQMPIIAVAHHADDQAETILFRLARGAGMQGLSGMKAVTQHFSPQLDEYVRIIRPLLDVRRSEIIRYLHEQNVAWREDPSNLTLDYARNRIRHKILPELMAIHPQAIESIVRSAKVLEESAERLERMDQALLDSLCMGEASKNRVVIDLKRWQSLEPAEQRAVLRLAIQKLQSEQDNLHSLSFEQIESLCQQLQSQKAASRPHPIAGDIVWSVVAEANEPHLLLSLHRALLSPLVAEHPQLANDLQPRNLQPNTTLQIGDWSLAISLLEIDSLPVNWQNNPNRWQAWLDADKINEAILTVAKEGMQIAPLGMNGKHKSLGDFFTDCKVHPSKRASWPLVIEQTNGEVLWVCGLAVGHYARITEETKQVLGLKWEISKRDKDLICHSE